MGKQVRLSESRKGKTLLRGHSLWREGQPIGFHGWSVGGVGVGGCSCGARSPELNSGAERKRWHKEHKAEVIRTAVPDAEGAD